MSQGFEKVLARLPLPGGDGRLHPYFAMKAMYESLPKGSIVIIDGGEAGLWALDLVEHARPGAAIVSTGYLGSLGNGWSYSLGAQID